MLDKAVGELGTKGMDELKDQYTIMKLDLSTLLEKILRTDTILHAALHRSEATENFFIE